MIPTVQWMRMAFHKFNNQYFGSKLAEPRFDTNPPQGDWGHYKPQAYVKRGVVTKLLGPGIISLTTKYSRSEKDVISTLLHEMIHMYTITCLGIYPNDQHDFNFQHLANRINQDGWNISATNEIKDTDVEGGDDTEEDYNNRTVKPCIFCVIQKPNGQNYKFWGFKAHQNLQGYIALAKQLKNYGADKLFIYYCYSHNMLSMPEGGKMLSGVGGETMEDMLLRLSRTIREKLTTQDFKLYKEISL